MPTPTTVSWRPVPGACAAAALPRKVRAAREGPAESHPSRRGHAQLRVVDESYDGSLAVVRPRVLVVDDERSIRMIVEVNLAAAGMEVLEAPDGKAALELVEQERPDLVLLDVMMPGIDGWDVARELAARPATREIPIVFLTARADPESRRLAHELGAVGYLPKPFDPLILATVLSGVIAGVAGGERERLRQEVLEQQ